MKITCEEKILILSTKSPLSKEEKCLIQNLLAQKIDWELLINLSRACQILPLIAKNLLTINSDLIPRLTLEETFKRHQMEYALNHLTLWNELKKIIKITAQKGIPFISIKGVILTEMLNRNIGLRRTSDIDILVKEEYLSKIEAELANLGYFLEPPQPQYKDFHLIFTKQKQQGMPIRCETHWDILPPVTRINHLIDDFWNNAVMRKISGEEVLSLSYEDLLFASALELYKDMGAYYLGYRLFLLKRHLDISGILQLYGKKINWGLFIKRTNFYGLRGLVYYALTFNKELFNNLKLPPEILQELKPSFAKRIFIARILNRLNLSEKSFSLHRLIFSLFISEIILLSNRWKVFSLRIFYWLFPDIYAYKKIRRINYVTFNTLRLFYRLLRKTFRKIRKMKICGR